MPSKAAILIADTIAKSLQTVADAITIVVCSFEAGGARTSVSKSRVRTFAEYDNDRLEVMQVEACLT